LLTATHCGTIQGRIRTLRGTVFGRFEFINFKAIGWGREKLCITSCDPQQHCHHIAKRKSTSEQPNAVPRSAQMPQFCVHRRWARRSVEDCHDNTAGSAQKLVHSCCVICDYKSYLHRICEMRASKPWRQLFPEVVGTVHELIDLRAADLQPWNLQELNSLSIQQLACSQGQSRNVRYRT
jgi:hypothetical protein